MTGEKTEPVVFNIQKYSIHDGDGIRTTVFFKGCPLSCEWCHNPESQKYTRELIFNRNKCTLCGRCVKECPNGANAIVDGEMVFDRSKCNVCGRCADYCLPGARELSGKSYTVKELVNEIVKDRIFYEQSGGGVTLSGGEVMAQDIDFIEQLCRQLHREGIRIYIDTCGMAPFEKFARILPYVDMFLYDIKLIDPEEHKRLTGADNSLILNNLAALSRAGAPIHIRIPVIAGVNATDDFMHSVAAVLKGRDISVRQISLLPYHNYARTKYAGLDRPYDDDAMKTPDPAQMDRFKEIFIREGFANTTIGG